MIAKSESVILFDGIYQAVREGSYIYLKFYRNGKACTIYTANPPKFVVNRWLYEDYRRDPSGRCRNYLIEGSKVKISSNEIDFWGDIRKDSLILNVDDRQYSYKGTHEFWFIKGPEYAKRPELELQKQKKKIAKKSPKAKLKKIDSETDEQLFKGEFVTEITQYDEYGLYHDIYLKNKKGEMVAKKLIIRNRYNPTQITGELIRDVADKDIHYSEIEGKAKNPMWLCLDKDGNILKKANKPVLVKPFQAIQKTEYKIKHHGAYKDKKYTIFYPCSNCASKTGIKECVYVW
jgi:hypothetical protein